jgi:hypothetical protein
MRHVLLQGTPATRPYRVGQPTTTARLVALTGRAPGVVSRRLCTSAGAIDLAAVAAAADQHLSAATRTHEQPGWRFHRRRPGRTWTASAMLGIMPRHACSARCGARRRSGLGGLGRRRACQSAGCHRASLRPSTPSCCAARARLWICGQRKSVAHIPTGPTINNKHQFDRFRRLGSDPARHIQPTVSPGSDDASTMTRAHLSADLDSHSQLIELLYQLRHPVRDFPVQASE